MLFEIIKEAFVSLGRNRTRSFLTLLGIAWGVTCFVVLITYGDGFCKAITLGFTYFGDNVTIIWNGQTSKQAGGQRAGRRIAMQLGDVEEVRKNATLVKRISPEFYRTYPLQSTRRLTTDGIRGVNEEYGDMRGHFIEEGRLLSPEDVQFARRVAVLGQGLRAKLFSEAPAVGEEIRINGVSFTVIGVLKKKVSMSNYFGQDDSNAFVPYTAMSTLTSTRYLSVMVVQPVNASMETPALAQVKEVLGRIHRFDPTDERAVRLNTWSRGYSMLTGITIAMRAFLLIVGILTLSIGGVGLMNVMLVAVTERTREIGIRKAMGARRRHILLQFLAEALIIASVGGALGYVFTQTICSLIGVLPFWSTILGDKTGQADIHMVVSMSAVLTSVTCLGLVGLLSGFFPALRASRLDPVESLRYE
ncbi:MAG: FtsX-like permease family protein [Acidobacteria bacterium]|nr:MAG: FtsX-like permease family protein [Acidobacteriota bacterium]